MEILREDAGRQDASFLQDDPAGGAAEFLQNEYVRGFLEAICVEDVLGQIGDDLLEGVECHPTPKLARLLESALWPIRHHSHQEREKDRSPGKARWIDVFWLRIRKVFSAVPIQLDWQFALEQIRLAD